MSRIVRAVMPFVAIAVSALAVFDVFEAVQHERWGRTVYKSASVIFWLFVAYMLYSTNKHIPRDTE